MLLPSFTVLAIVSLLNSAFAAPTSNGAISQLTADTLVAIAPTSNTCDGAQYPKECATNKWAAQIMSSAFKNFGTTSAGEMAALVSLMAYESGEFKFNFKHYPPTAGSGTRSMMMIDFNLQYAAAFPSLKDKLNQITGGQTSSASLSDDKKNQVVQLLIDNNADFGSASWYLITKCPEVRNQLISMNKSSGTAAWEAYITQCVQGTMDDGRKQYFLKAAKAFGVQ